MIERYDHPEIRKIWSEENKYSLWCRIELAFLKAFKGIEVDDIHITPEIIHEIQVIEEKTKHDLAAFVQWLEAYLQPLIGANSRYVHYGLTSSDIVDTAFSLMIKDTDSHIKGLIEEIGQVLDELAEKYEDVQILGRTHGQAAEVISLFDKFTSYGSVLQYLRPCNNCYGRLAGSVGDCKYFDEDIAIAALGSLGLFYSHINDGQIIHRSLYATHMNDWALLASSLAKMATDIRLLSQSGIEEIREGFSAEQVGSSSMPQKRNPILCENLCGLARVVRGHQIVVMQNIELWNERDISHSSAERIVFPDTAVLLGFMFTRMISVLKNLYVDQSRIKYNLDSCKDQISAQAEMLKLIDSGMSRTEAHKHIKDKVHR